MRIATTASSVATKDPLPPWSNHGTITKPGGQEVRVEVLHAVVDDRGRPEEEEGGGDAGHEDVGAVAPAVGGLVGAGRPGKEKVFRKGPELAQLMIKIADCCSLPKKKLWIKQP